MGRLERIAQELKDHLGQKVFLLVGNEGKIKYGPVFAATLYEIEEDEENNVIIDFNEYFQKLFGEETDEYKKTKEFGDEKGYRLNLKKYGMGIPKPPPGILY